MPKAKLPNEASVDTNDCIVNYTESLCRQRHSKKNNSLFRSVSFKLQDSQGWGTFTLPENKVKQFVRSDGKVVPNRLTLDLGNAEDVRFVSIRREDNTYERKAFFNRTIKSLINAEKKAYLQSIAI